MAFRNRSNSFSSSSDRLGRAYTIHSAQAQHYPSQAICDTKNKKPDLKKYEIKYHGDSSASMFKKLEGTVVHDRQWNYNLQDFYSIVNVGVEFKANCTFTIKNSGAVKRLAIVDQDDPSSIYGKLELNLHPGVPCVCACVEDIKVRKQDMRVRVATAIKDKNPKDCADCSPRRPLIVGEGEVEETITKTQKRYATFESGVWRWKDTNAVLTQEEIVKVTNKKERVAGFTSAKSDI